MTRLERGWESGDQDTVVAALDRAVQAHGDELFLDFGGVGYSYAAVFARVERLAAGLQDLGVTPGDTVVTILDNNLDAVASWFAINLLGAIWVPVNTAYKGEFLRHQVSDAGAAVVIAEPDYAVRLLNVAAGLPELRVVLHRAGTVDSPESGVRLEPLESHLGDGGDHLRRPAVRPADLTCLIYTAGTTGPSKGCMISHNYACNLARQSLRVTTRRPDEVNWTPLPLFHLNATATSVLTSALIGGSASFAERFSLSGFWADIERTGARMVSVLGSMIPLIAAMPETPEMLRCHGQIRIAIGAPFTPELVRAWRDRFGVERVGNGGYGLSEAALITLLPDDGEQPEGASGKHNDDFDVRIVDDDDRELPPGEVGEIICRPLRPHVMFEGYWRRADATAALMRNLWFHTGDLGRFDDDGWFYFVDRKKDYLRRRGENISSFEMESALARHPDIAEVAVHAVPSELTEDDVKVTAVLHPGATLTEAALCSWAIEELPWFAVPRYIEFREQLPKNPVGRVLKYQLRAEGCTPSTWDREAAGVAFARR